MKLIRADAKRSVFHLSRRERGFLLELLRLYPLVPAASKRHRISVSDEADAEQQRMLDEALAAQRKENKRQVLAMLSEPGRLVATKTGFNLTLSPPQMDWLLQIINDVRVGSWIALGSPDTERGQEIPLNAETAPRLWTMEVAGYFETELIKAMSGGGQT